MGSTFTIVNDRWTVRFEAVEDGLKLTIESISPYHSMTMTPSDVDSLRAYFVREFPSASENVESAYNLVHKLKSYDRMRLTSEDAELREQAARELYLLSHEVQTAHALLRETRRYILEDSLYFEPPTFLIPRMNDLLDDDIPQQTSRKKSGK